MRGTYKIQIRNKRIRYDFEVRRNISVIRGNSGTGKTTLIEMIREYDENGEESGIHLSCKKNCTVLNGRNWMKQLSTIRDSIVFIDEGNKFISSKEFASEIRKTDNYYVIVSREGIPTLPYSVDEIYGIRESGKYGFLDQTYNEFYHIYSEVNHSKVDNVEIIITEDSNAGYQFFKNISEIKGYNCKYAGGKSNIYTAIFNAKEKNILIIADGAAFGSEMEKVKQLIDSLDKLVVLYLPESFEWLILKSDLIHDKEVNEILAEPSDYIESNDYFSWERYFTKLLIEKTENSYLQYQKSTLNPVYLQKNETEKIVEVMENIIL